MGMDLVKLVEAVGFPAAGFVMLYLLVRSDLKDLRTAIGKNTEVLGKLDGAINMLAQGVLAPLLANAKEPSEEFAQESVRGEEGWNC